MQECVSCYLLSSRGRLVLDRTRELPLPARYARPELHSGPPLLLCLKNNFLSCGFVVEKTSESCCLNSASNFRSDSPCATARLDRRCWFDTRLTCPTRFVVEADPCDRPPGSGGFCFNVRIFFLVPFARQTLVASLQAGRHMGRPLHFNKWVSVNCFARPGKPGRGTRRVK